MRMIRFKEDIMDGEDLIWQKGNIYQIINEDSENFWIDSDSILDQSYAISKSSLNSCCFVYNCNGSINNNCQYCKGLLYDGNEPYCIFIKGVG